MGHDLLGNEFYDLDRFRARSERFLFAARRNDPGGALVYIEQGTANEVRPFTKANLICPEPDCLSPDLTTVNREPGGARDGYRHLTKGASRAHVPESALHRQGKALIERWASRTPEVSDVDVEVRLGVDPVTAHAERVADVLLTTVHGTRIAVEVQYAGISVEEWRERTASYRRLGIGVTWLFGSRGANSPLDHPMRSVHREVLDAKVPLLWINPTDEVLGWLEHARFGKSVGSWNEASADLAFGSLDDLEVHPDGLYPIGWHADQEARAAAQAAANEAARIKAEADWAARTKRAEELAKAREAFAARPVAPPEPRPMTAREKRLAYIAKKEAEAAPRTQPAPRRRPRPPEPSKPHCKRCGLPIDPILKGGYHSGCA